MNGIIRSCFLAFLPLLPLQSAQALEQGEVAPHIALPSRNGDTVTLESMKGKVVYLDFWASWCGPCKRSLPWMSEIQSKFQNSGFAVVAVNLDSSRDDAEKLLGDHSSNITVLFDSAGSAPEQYNLKTMPTSFLLDPQGRIVSIHEGFHDQDKDSIVNEIENLLKGDSK